MFMLLKSQRVQLNIPNQLNSEVGSPKLFTIPYQLVFLPLIYGKSVAHLPIILA